MANNTTSGNVTDVVCPVLVIHVKRHTSDLSPDYAARWSATADTAQKGGDLQTERLRDPPRPPNSAETELDEADRLLSIVQVLDDIVPAYP